MREGKNLYNVERVGLLEQMKFEQPFERGGGEEFSSCRGQSVQRPQGGSIPAVSEE